MATRKQTDEFLEKILNDSAWKELSENFAWTEQMLEKHKNKVDWKGISGNCNIVWTPSMLEKFKELIDWQELSDTGCETIFTENCLEQFKDYWDWSKLSGNRHFEFNCRLIDKFIDRWDWAELINRWCDDNLYNAGFLERYADRIPSNLLQDSHLWEVLVEERAKELKLEIIS